MRLDAFSQGNVGITQAQNKQKTNNKMFKQKQTKNKNQQT